MTLKELLSIYNTVYTIHNSSCMQFKELIDATNILSENDLELLEIFHKFSNSKQKLIITKLKDL